MSQLDRATATLSYILRLSSRIPHLRQQTSFRRAAKSLESRLLKDHACVAEVEQAACRQLSDLLERWHLVLRQHVSFVGQTSHSASASACASASGRVFRFNAFDPLLFESPSSSHPAAAALVAWQSRHTISSDADSQSLVASLLAPPHVPAHLTLQQYHCANPQLQSLKAAVNRLRQAEQHRIQAKK